MRNFSIVSALIALALLSACASSNEVVGITSANDCTGCHGGKDNTSGAPPFDTHNNTTTAAPGVGAHTAHVDAGVKCANCHATTIDGAGVILAGGTHQNGTADVNFGSLADPSHVATYDRTSHSCSNVYCHKPLAAPGTLPAPPWNDPTVTITGCGACHATPPATHGPVALTQCVLCHPTTVDSAGAIVAGGGTHSNGAIDAYQHDPGWATTNASGVTPHGMAALYQSRATFPNGFDDCRSCHGSNLDNPIASTAPSCDACHTGGTAAWRTDCTFCHGDATRAPAGFQIADAAPPRDVSGNTASARVGAHQAHLFGIANTPRISDGVACDDCHGGTTRTLPTSFEPHANGTTEVTLKRPGQNAATGSYDPATGTCSNVYCHGNLPRNPKTPANNPSWTATGGQTDCGTCHAANGTYGAADTMTGQHGPHRCAACHGNSTASTFSTQVGCFACHAGYQRQLGTTSLTPPVVNVNLHVDGAVEVVPTTAAIYNGFTVSLTYTAPGPSTPASCTTNCHAIGEHQNAGAPQSSATW